MEWLKKNKKLLSYAAAFLAFFATYAGCIVMGWHDVVNLLFPSSGENIAEHFEIPVYSLLLSLLFYLVMYILAIVGIKTKNKVMVFLPLLYEIIFVLSFVMFAVFSAGGIGGETLYNIVYWVLIFALAPSFGTMWSLPLILFVIMIITLIILTIVGIVKTFKKPKDEVKKGKAKNSK